MFAATRAPQPRSRPRARLGIRKRKGDRRRRSSSFRMSGIIGALCRFHAGNIISEREGGERGERGGGGRRGRQLILRRLRGPAANLRPRSVATIDATTSGLSRATGGASTRSAALRAPRLVTARLPADRCNAN